jgi:assimilatory nitrate reductase catalytic subunit
MNAPLAAQPSVRTTCPYCGVGCGVLVRPGADGKPVVTGDPDHPANFGRLCSKGFALGETLADDSRLLEPMLRQPDGGYARTDWSAALDKVAGGLTRILARDGPGAIAFYLSGQLLTEDYYVANKLAKGFLGTAHVDTNSRLCMASTVAGQRRAFGGDLVPGCYEDLDVADLIVLVGSNAAWCHPVLHHRIVANRKARGATVVAIDPRRTVTAEDADLHLPIRPGTDTALFCGLLVHLAERDALNRDFIADHTSGFNEALARAREIAPSPRATAAATGLAEHDVVRFFNLFLETRNAVTCFSQGINQSAQGTDKVNAIVNCHLATGRIGRPGMGPFSLTGQPNAMGGREVGGLANQLAAHMTFAPEDVARVARFWNAPRMATREGLKAVQMFEAIGRGEIKALWVMGTNPAVSLPNAGAVRDALSRLELFVVSENVPSNDTISARPHVLLPAAAWGDKNGTVTNSERCISRQRAFRPLPGSARPDWRILCDVAQRMGFREGFSFRSAAEVFREHAALSAFENEGARGFDIGGLADLSEADYDALQPVQWPVRRNAPPQERLFADGGFVTPDRRARRSAPEPPALRQPTDPAYPLRLNTGRIRDQWHTMTRTGLSATLAGHRPEPFVEVHPDDAETFGLADGGFARVATAHGRCTLRVVTTAKQPRSSIFVPIHWSDATASSARIGELVAPLTDPFSGQPEAKATPAAIEPVAFAYRGLLLSRDPMQLDGAAWWARAATSDACGLLFASDDNPARWRERAPELFPEAVLTEFADRKRGLYRMAAFRDGRLEGALFVGPAAGPTPWQDGLPVGAGPGAALAGPVVCACYGVGLAAIREAMASRRAVTADEIGRALRAGTKCGSCLPELRSLAANAKANDREQRREPAHAG